MRDLIPDRGYTPGMKTAISLPDELFSQVERLVHGSGRSRSEVYGQALREYVARHSPDAITDALDQIIADVGEDPSDAGFRERAALRVLRATEW